MRLLIPAGSKLLDLPDIHEVISGFDEVALTYRWQHPDVRVDRLCDDAIQLVQSGEAEGASRQEIFSRLWAAAHKAAALPTPPLPASTQAPHVAPFPTSANRGTVEQSRLRSRLLRSNASSCQSEACFLRSAGVPPASKAPTGACSQGQAAENGSMGKGKDV